MRRTGRTTRIVNFTVEQLLSVGEVVITDHTTFEFSGRNVNMINHFIDQVKRRILDETRGKHCVFARIIPLEPGSDIDVVYFNLKGNNNSVTSKPKHFSDF